MAYTYRVEKNYLPGIPQTKLSSPLRPSGISMHWTAGAPGRAGALGTAQFFVDRADRNASYHILVYWENRIFGVMWIVPVVNAAHSMNPNVPPYDPNAEVRRILGTRVNDPNAACIAVSFCGMPVDLDKALADPDFLHGYRRLVGELSAISSMAPRPMFNHGWAQPSTRTDAGRLIVAITGVTTIGDEMQFWKPVQESWTTKSGTKFWDGAGNEKVFTSVERITSIAESNDGKLRLARYGDEILVVDRTGLTVVPGTRIPATGYGFAPPPTPQIVEVVKEVPTGITQSDVTLAEAKAIAAERLRIRKILEI